MKPLTDIGLPTAKPAKGKKLIPIFNLPPVGQEGPLAEQYPALVDVKDPVAAYRKAALAEKDAKATMEALKPYIVGTAVEAIFHENAVRPEPLSSVRLATDGSAPDAETLLVSLADKYPAFDQANAEAAFEALGKRRDGKPVKLDDYLRWNVVAKFDTAVFFVNGVFDKERYEAFSEAVAAVAAQFEVETPLACGKVLGVKDDFHTRRLADFTAEQNIELHAAVPAQVSVKL